jgi:hypothetical protein
MNQPIPWVLIKELVRYTGAVIMLVWGIKLIMCMITELFSRTCRHCGKKV